MHAQVFGHMHLSHADVEVTESWSCYCQMVCVVCVWLLLWCRFFLFFLICAVAYTCGRLALFSSECFSRLQPLAGSTSRRPKTLFTTSYDFWERNGISQTDLISAHHNQRVCKYHSDIDLNCRNENVWKLSVVQMFYFFTKTVIFLSANCEIIRCSSVMLGVIAVL